jgi:hypothetical protein
MTLGNRILMFQERNVARFFNKYASYNEGPKSFDMFRLCKGNIARKVIPAALEREHFVVKLWRAKTMQPIKWILCWGNENL